MSFPRPPIDDIIPVKYGNDIVPRCPLNHIVLVRTSDRCDFPIALYRRGIGALDDESVVTGWSRPFSLHFHVIHSCWKRLSKVPYAKAKVKETATRANIAHVVHGGALSIIKPARVFVSSLVNTFNSPSLGVSTRKKCVWPSLS
jgi:hypothetical protein